jgi:hypothetical protein
MLAAVDFGLCCYNSLGEAAMTSNEVWEMMLSLLPLVIGVGSAIVAIQIGQRYQKRIVEWRRSRGQGIPASY